MTPSNGACPMSTLCVPGLYNIEEEFVSLVPLSSSEYHLMQGVNRNTTSSWYNRHGVRSTRPTNRLQDSHGDKAEETLGFVDDNFVTSGTGDHLRQNVQWTMPLYSMGERDEQAKARFDRGLPVDDESGDSNIGCSKTKNNTDPTYIVSTCSGSLELEQPNTIQLVPGVNLVLRGAEETMQAIGNDFYVATHCFDCQAMLFCIRNAGFLVCPHCRVVSPVESNENTNEHFALSKNNGNICGSVGLGFTLDELCEYQTMIVSARMADTVVCEE